MRALATLALIAVLMPTMMTVRVSAAAPAALTVRLYNTSGIPAPELVAARHAAAAILGDIGLDVVFRHCRRVTSPEAPVDACAEPLTPSEVVVRIITAPAFNTTLHADAYGVAYVVRETDRGWLATVFSDRIHHAAARVAVDSGTLLGRVVAHEVGHLLLGSGYHGDAGVMRGDWPDHVLTRTADEWRFSVLEAARMHRVLASPRRGALATAARSAIAF